MCIRDRSVAIEIIDYIDNLERKEEDQHHYYSALVLRSDATSPVFVKLCTQTQLDSIVPVSYTHLRAHETVLDLVCRLLLEKKK